MLKKLSVFFLALALVFSLTGTSFGYGVTYETLVVSDGTGSTASVWGTYTWNTGTQTYQHGTESYYIEEYATEEYWITDGTNGLYSSVGDLYATTFHDMGTTGYDGDLNVAGGDVFTAPVTPTGTFAGLSATLDANEIGGHMVDLFASVWVIVALAIAFPLAFYLIFKMRETVPVDARDYKSIRRASEKARKEHQRDITRKN